MIYELKHFTNLVIRLENPEIQSVDALLIRLVGDRVAGTMLKTLLYWMPKSVRSDGRVYKSWRHWLAECVLTIAQVKRVHRERLLEPFGVGRVLKKADGSPTTHYGVDFTVLLHKVADFLKVGVGQVTSWMVDELPPTKTSTKKVLKAEAAKPSKFNDFTYSTESEKPFVFEHFELTSLEDRTPMIGDFSAREVWKLTCQQLKGIIERGLYDTFLARTEYVTLDEASKVMTVATPNNYATENLAGRLYPRVLRTFQAIAGTGWMLKFVTRPAS